LEWFKSQLKKPVFCKSAISEIFDNSVDFILKNTTGNIGVIYIEGNRGTGKTRTANEIAETIKAENKKSNIDTEILFGDCDEAGKDTTMTPYEPFCQAFEKLLHVGHFSDPTAKAQQLKNGLTQLGADAALGAMGLGAFTSLIGADDPSDASTKKTTNEIAKVLAETLAGIAQKKQIIFILDDVHWIDDESFAMFSSLLTFLRQGFKQNEIAFILTAHSGSNRVKELLEKEGKDNKITLSRMDFQPIEKYEEKNADQIREFIEALLISLKLDDRTIQILTQFLEERVVSCPLHILQTLNTILEKGWFREDGEEFCITRDASLKSLPPPKEYNNMIKEQLSGIDQKIIDILQCCSMIGRTFNVSVAAEIFQIDILEFLDMLKVAESKGLVEDLQENDDLFHFTDKRMVVVFKNLNMKSFGDVDNAALEQRVREYRKRYIMVLENRKLKLNKNEIMDDDVRWAKIKEILKESLFDYQEIISLALHTYAIRDVYPERAFFYNKMAAESSYKRCLFKVAGNHFKNAITVTKKCSELNVDFDDIAAVYIEYCKCLLDEETDSDLISQLIKEARDQINSCSKDSKKEQQATVGLDLIEILIYYRTGKYHKALDLSEKIITGSNATEEQKVRARFYHTISLNRKEVNADKRKDLILEIILDTDVILKENKLNVESQRIKSEALNELGKLYLFEIKDFSKAADCFNKSIKIKSRPEINDRKGIAIAHGGLGDCYKEKGDLIKAESEYTENLEISRINGDNQGICRMTSMIAGIKIELSEKCKDDVKKKKMLTEAEKLYKESLMIAEDQGERGKISICFALAGLLDVEALIKNEEEKSRITSFVRKKLESITESEIPDFLKDKLISI
jgi:tetratricopeptide (TPR) repeat protein/Cdc6-like AAA superfamily ATPase